MNFIYNSKIQIATWMLTLPPGENFSIIEKSISNYRQQGKTEKEIAHLICEVFSNEISEYMNWLSQLKLEYI
jgi:hypothetical protein